ncbi:MAG: four-carbon acid sugar kinase family protein [Candidatus Sericytochromatia bacterium]
MSEHWPALQAGPVGVIADDLTGACDTALQYLTPEGSVWVAPELGEAMRWPSGFTAWSLNTESRHLGPALAARQVEAAVQALTRAGCRQFYKKIDSTLRGNIAAEIRQAIASLTVDFAIVAPAFPPAGRITVGGYQLVDGLPVAASHYARDPLAPVTEGHLPTLLAAGETPAALIELKTVMAGPEAIATAIVRAVGDRPRVLVADAARMEDLHALARALAMTPFRALPVGSAGFARALQPHRLLPRPEGRTIAVVAGPVPRPPVLVVAGSLNPVTTAQVSELAKEARLVKVDVEALLLTESTGRERLAASVLQALLAGQDVILTTGASEEAMRKGAQLGRDLMMGAVQTGGQLAAALGQVVASLASQAPLAGVVLAGGETALGALRAMGSPPLRVVAELLPAIPLCQADLPGGPLRVVTKSGGFGDRRALVELVARLKREQAFQA